MRSGDGVEIADGLVRRLQGDMVKDQFDAPIEVSSNGKKYSFETASSLAKWARVQADGWHRENLPVDRQSKSFWANQEDTFSGIANRSSNLSEALKSEQSDEKRSGLIKAFKNEIQGLLGNIANRNVITIDHPEYPAILVLAAKDINAAGYLLTAVLASQDQHLLHLLNSGSPLVSALVRAAFSPFRGLPDLEDAMHAHQEAFFTLKSELQAELEKQRKTKDDLRQELIDIKAKFSNDQDERGATWSSHISTVTQQWDAAIKAYDEKMALAAPTTYWATRRKQSQNRAIAFSISFAVMISIALYLFGVYGLPHLSASAKPGVSILISVLPVLIPAFAAVWLLRILGRQLSENLQLMQDASERETMVKTFLALMNDEVRGKSLVTDDDRLLILHALFRPSSLSAADDSPPVHWFDILSRKYGGPRP